MSDGRLVHHELCFGCGRTNLFGLLMEIERVDHAHVRGRGFVKQDHQGPERGRAHEGVLAAALSEAMALACGLDARASWIEIRLHASVPVGTFVEVEAGVDGHTGDHLDAHACARVDEQVVGSARGIYESTM